MPKYYSLAHTRRHFAFSRVDWLEIAQLPDLARNKLGMECVPVLYSGATVLTHWRNLSTTNAQVLTCDGSTRRLSGAVGLRQTVGVEEDVTLRQTRVQTAGRFS